MSETTTTATVTPVAHPANRRIGTAIVSAVFGVVAFTVGLVFSTTLGIILAGIGLLFGGVAVYRSREGRSVWIPALILNGLTLLVGVLSYFG